MSLYVHSGVFVQFCIWIHLRNMEIKNDYSWKCFDLTLFVDFNDQSAIVSIFRFLHQRCGFLLRTLHALPVWIISSYSQTRSEFDCFHNLNRGLCWNTGLRFVQCLFLPFTWDSTCPRDPVIRNQLNNNKRTDRPITAVVVCFDGAHHHNFLNVHIRLRVPLWSFSSTILEESNHLALRPFHRALIYVCCLPTKQVAGGSADLWSCTQTAVSAQDWAWIKQMQDIYKTWYHIYHIMLSVYTRVPKMDGWADGWMGGWMDIIWQFLSFDGKQGS